MKTLYVLMYNVPYEFGECFGVYDTLEKAEVAKDKASKPYYDPIQTRPNGKTYRTRHKRHINDLSIEEFILNEDKF